MVIAYEKQEIYVEVDGKLVEKKYLKKFNYLRMTMEDTGKQELRHNTYNGTYREII